MCGICGKLEFQRDKQVSASLLKDMADTVRHRGPDDEGFYVCGQVGLAFRRLSIIDLEGGHQPLSNENATIWIVFNGEIYNYRSLREQLVAKGHVFRTHSDTEVIVHLYEDYGFECVQKLRGMFAFAIWDSTNETLFLARDRLGIKPLYWYLGKDSLLFGSEMKAILADPDINRDVDLDIIDRFLTYYYVPGTNTLIRNLFKLQPGHTLVAQKGSVQVRQYWDLNFACNGNHHSSRNLDRDFVELLNEAVQLHLVSDVPVGFLLSGGVDSTAMLSFAAKTATKPISTYTVGFSSPGLVDERPFAQLAARRFGSTHHDTSISADDFVRFLPEYVWHMEEPVCEPPAVALYYVSKLASRDVKVLISGEGADEAFAGYQNYRNLFWLETTKRTIGPLRRPAGQGMRLLGQWLNSRVLSKYASLMDAEFTDYYLSRTSTPFRFFNQATCELYSANMADKASKTSSLEIARRYLRDKGSYNILEKMLYVDTKTWLPDVLLIKTDKMTMANSVELRVPFLDHKVMEFAAGLPRNQKVRGWKLKYLEKHALRGHVPAEILSRSKAGFPVPYASWLRNSLKEWVSETLLDRKTISRGYFKRSAIEKLIALNSNGQDYSKEIFSLIVLELWHRAFADKH
jgi:asparagine synthase (glutamine-hydrolysing)